MRTKPKTFLLGLGLLTVAALAYSASTGSQLGLSFTGLASLLTGDLHWAALSGIALASTPLVLTPEQVTEFQSILGDIKGGWAEVKALPATFKSFQDENTHLRKSVEDLRRRLVSSSQTSPAPRTAGAVSENLARYEAAVLIALCQKSNRLDALCSRPAQRDFLLDFARSTLDLTTRAALTTSDIPLPEQYGSEMRELISAFGVVRRKMFPYPIGMGTARPARMGTRPGFGSIAMSAAFPEVSPTIAFASLESHKVGGIVRVPREIDEQSLVAMGEFLARYGAVEFARAEDTWGFLADGSPTYESVKGVVQIARDNTKTVVLGEGKTAPADVTLEDFRELRRKVNKAALNGRLSAYYLDTTWETHLASFRTEAEPNIYQRLPDGTALLDGYPIIWTDVLQPYGVDPAANKAIAVFGALSFWWFGEHGTPRIDSSEHVWFANDQLAVRFVEEIDFDYAAVDATAALITAAA